MFVVTFARASRLSGYALAVIVPPMRKPFLLLLVCIFCSSGALLLAAETRNDFEKECEKIAAQRGHDAERLHKLFDVSWAHAMEDSPESATDFGYPGKNDRWTDLSVEAIARRKREPQVVFKVIESIDRSKLSPTDQLNFDLFRKNTAVAKEGTRFPSEFLALSQMDGVQQDAVRLLNISPRKNVKDYEDILARLQKLSLLIDQTIVLLSDGLKRGVTPPKITLRDVPQQVSNQMVADPKKNPALLIFEDMPSEISAGDRERLKAQASRAVNEKVIPAFQKLRDFLTERYLPGARESIGMSDLPDGKAWYQYNVRTTTTTSMAPKEIHELGLSEVKRIRAEMEKVMAEAGFKGTFEEFSTFLRSDKRFYFQDKESLLVAYRDIAKRADPELAHLFGKLPRLPYGVKPVPTYAEKSQTTAYYEPGSPQAGRPGYFFANTYALETRPRWEMEALTLHEAVPGHHLQIALAQEMEGAPEFRKHGFYTAFVEGWGLYSESLGYEMGFYKDPYTKYGQLTYEMWRAVRLVVDTGMHSMGWSRQQAIDFFKANTSKTEHDITVEVDRYIVWPGQALAYKIGQLKLRELRTNANRELGNRFDVREFHDQVLGNGALPLDILETRVEAWVKEGGGH
jgi:uncharacterized protein (DUF885 family)